MKIPVKNLGFRRFWAMMSSINLIDFSIPLAPGKIRWRSGKSSLRLELSIYKIFISHCFGYVSRSFSWQHSIECSLQWFPRGFLLQEIQYLSVNLIDVFVSDGCLLVTDNMVFLVSPHLSPERLAFELCQLPPSASSVLPSPSSLAVPMIARRTSSFCNTPAEAFATALG